MRRPSAAALVAIAAALSLLSALAMASLPLLGLSLSFTDLVIGALGLYTMALIGWTRPGVGRVSGWLLTAIVTAGALILSAIWPQANSLWIYVLLGWLWLVRCALLHRSLLAVLGDGALLAIGIAAAIWAFQFGAGLALSLWSFLLVQALLPWIRLPAKNTLPDHHASSDPGDFYRAGSEGVTHKRFEQASHRADQALRRIYAGSTP